jgi:hypothetical protein
MHHGRGVTGRCCHVCSFVRRNEPHLGSNGPLLRCNVKGLVLGAATYFKVKNLKTSGA